MILIAVCADWLYQDMELLKKILGIAYPQHLYILMQFMFKIFSSLMIILWLVANAKD